MRIDQSIFHIYFDFLHQHFREEKNVQALQSLLNRTRDCQKCSDLLHEIHAIDPSFGWVVFKEWMRNEEFVEHPLFFYEHYLLRTGSPFHPVFATKLALSESTKKEFSDKASSFIKWTRKDKKRDVDFIVLISICLTNNVFHQGYLLSEVRRFCRERLSNDLANWKMGIDVLCDHAPTGKSLRALLEPNLLTDGNHEIGMEKLKVVIDRKDILTDAQKIAIDLAEPLIFQGQFHLIEKLVATKENDFIEKLRVDCLFLQSCYQRLTVFEERVQQGEKGTEEIVSFCNELMEEKPFPATLYLRACLLIAEQSKDISVLSNLLAKLSFEDRLQIKLLKKIGITIKERKESERLPIAKEILSILHHKKVKEKWLDNFASSEEPSSGIFIRYKDREWHETLTKHLSALSR